MGKKRLNQECARELNHFSGVLPYHHNEIACHNASQKRRHIICEMKKMVKHIDMAPKCNEWEGIEPTAEGPFKFGEFRQVNGKPWEPHRVKSSELVGSQLTPACHCTKRNGLQDDCRMTQCRGKLWCLTEPWPECPPFTRVPRVYNGPDPLEICPNVCKGKYMADTSCTNTSAGGGHLVQPSYDPNQVQMYSYPEFPRELYIGNEGANFKLQKIDNACGPPLFMYSTC